VSSSVAKPPIFLTGATGFVGRRVARLLAAGGFTDVRLLSRDPGALTTAAGLPAQWRVVRGDLANPLAWADHLEGVDTVLHLASSTGKVRGHVHFSVIGDGTKRLIDEARRVGVPRLLHVSSVAAAFANRRYYLYADAKTAAEAVVRESGMEWLIVRPTMVLGPGSPVLAGLRKLATLPLPVVFGDAKNEVQPIDVDDIARILVAALDVRPWNGATLTLGGPDVVTLAELMSRIRLDALGGKGSGTLRFVHLPLGFFRELLGMAEPLLFPVLPFTAGQLATFANPSVAEPHPMSSKLPAPRVRLAEMLNPGRGSDG
jgi:uncharacterized protein YbjT (DUF2867 family)